MSLLTTPSIVTTPEDSAILNKTDSREDLPAPVLPTIPIYTQTKQTLVKVKIEHINNRSDVKMLKNQPVCTAGW